MRFSATALAEALRGRLVGPEVPIEGVATDSRGVKPGQLFVPLRGARDGHDFIAPALDAGAVAYLTDGVTSDRGTAIVVPDPALALMEIGRVARARLNGQVVGITGSVGKTTVKDLTSGVFASFYRTTASRLSFNNEIGLPLTLANADEDVEVVVAELGARGPGHIADLCAVARPTVGIITRIGLAHTEFFGTLEQVAAAKAELFEALPPSGLAALNGDDPMAPMISDRSAAPVLRFGLGRHCDVMGDRVTINEQAQAAFHLSSPWGNAPVQLALHGEHQVTNALGALTAALWVGVPLDRAVEALARVQDPPGRMNVASLPGGIVLVNDSYNANPTSTEAALRVLRALPGDRRIAVLGAMAELGEGSEDHHRSIRALAGSLGIVVIGYRTPDYGDGPASDVGEVIARLGGLRSGDAILVKGSRATAMESVAASLEQTLTQVDGVDAGPG
jgi:UDP-N-acetylmuramoyl-tripeptide--D-alanyl-D-alanine ligase